MGLHRHHNDCAAVCRVVPFRLWASVVSPPKARACGVSVGPGEARTGSAVAPGAESEAVVRYQQPSSRAGVVTQGEQASSARIACWAQIESVWPEGRDGPHGRPMQIRWFWSILGSDLPTRSRLQIGIGTKVDGAVHARSFIWFIQEP
jgi:hypothetical protein